MRELGGYFEGIPAFLAEPLFLICTDGKSYPQVRGAGHEIGSWRVTSLSEGLARVIETDSPRSRTLVVSTFPTPLSRTERAPFNALGSPKKQPLAMRIRKGLRITRPPNSVQSGLFLLPPFALCAAFRHSLVGHDSYDYYGGSVTMPLTRFR